MRIEGIPIAEKIYGSLAPRKTTALAIVLAGNNPQSLLYIRQKEKAAARLGIALRKYLFENPSIGDLNEKIIELNADTSVHGIIVQRPLPDGLGGLATIRPEKDVDGFEKETRFTSPVALAVRAIIEQVTGPTYGKICVIGKGSTAGTPIIRDFANRGIRVTVIDSKTGHPEEITRRADIVISAVGKPNIVRRDMIKKGSVLVAVGMWQDRAGKWHGDYDPAEIEDVASYYTPVPGGVGPVNVAFLMANTIQAASI